MAVGCNEVPTSLGGQYWSDDDATKDFRDFQIGEDRSTTAKREMFSEIIHRLKNNGWLSPDKQGKQIDELVREALTGGHNSIMHGSRLMSVLEFGRVVHAEMAALSDAARRGIAVRDTIMFVTTFPCHMCARHIIAAGIDRVVYVEPYPKSLAYDLYKDSIVIDSQGDSESRVAFDPFEGVAPRRYMEMFEMPKRKNSEGKAVKWEKHTAQPRIERLIASYVLVEQSALSQLDKELADAGFKPAMN